MPSVSEIFRNLTVRSRRKRSGGSINSTTSSKSSTSKTDKKSQHLRTVSAPITNGYHENTEPNGAPQPKPGRSEGAASYPTTPAANKAQDTNNLHGLADAAAIANAKPELSKTEKALNAVEGMALSASAESGNVTVFATILTNSLEATGGMDVVKDHITSLIESTAPLMQALDAVQKIHPFIGVAVLAFKSVWNLEMTRRANNQKVLTLHLEMRDMIGVLVKLETVKDPDRVGPGGKTIANRLQNIVSETADTIKQCANACDTYTKKKIIIKVLSGPMWEGKLANFAGHFTKLRTDFEFELSIHTAVGVDNANKKLDDIQAQNDVVNKKIETMMEMLKKMSSPQELKMQKAVDRKGGRQAVLENEALLKEVSKNELTGSGTKANGKPYTFEDLQDDLRADIDQLLKKNMDLFSRKVQMQQEKLTQEVKDEVKRSSDRVIAVLEGGPHQRLLDRDIYNLWKDMQWRGSVKSRYFIMTLRDFFHEKWGSNIKSADGNNFPAAANRQSDEWALAYLDIQRLQPICESFDDDASGFITINEVNVFTSARPRDWSLLHWIAFWAIGWHQSISHYAGKIRQVFAKMFAILPSVTDVNLPHFHKYIDEIYQDVTTVEASVNPCFVNEALQAKFTEYIESEEKRLKKNLETIRYDIDDVDTLQLIAGPGRIGKFIHCLLYLVLERHLEIFRLAQKEENIIHPDELWDAANSIHCIIKAYKERYDLLLSVFRQQRLDPKQQFETFAHGMFRYMHDPRGLWSPKVVNTQVHPNFVYDDNLEDPTVYTKTKDILIHGLVEEGLDYAAYDRYPPKLEPFGLVDPLLEPILGTWNALLYRNTVPTLPNRGMITMSLLPIAGGGNGLDFKASSRSASGNFTVTGNCIPSEDGTINIRLKRQFNVRVPTQYWDGIFDPRTETISGTWGTALDRESHFGVFILKRTDPLDFRFRPAPIEFQEDKAKALWKYARLAILSQIKRKAWKWSYFKERKEIRDKFFELYIRNGHFGKPLDADEMMEWRRVRHNLTSADVLFYQSFVDFKVRKAVRHNIPCKKCHGQIGKARTICLHCQDKNTSETVDLCSPCQRECESKAEILENAHGGLPHLPTHEVVKVRRVIHIRDFGRLYRDASKTLQFVRSLFTPAKLLRLESGYDSDYPSQSIEEHDVPDTPTSVIRSLDVACTHCKESISLPCWCYINPEAGTFICDSCEEKGLSEKHDLVRCQHTDAEFKQGLNMDERLANLENRFVALSDELQGLNSKVDVRFKDIEALLRAALHVKQPEEQGNE